PLFPMPDPLCLVYNSDDGMLSLNPMALAVLHGVTQPMVVVAIAGPYRTGKSFLMNRLAQKRSGFPLGPTVKAQTKGIWMWCLPHPHQPGVVLTLLDTEGLSDPHKGDSSNDAWIFTLALLLSSTLVYNSVGTIDEKALEQLRLVTELTERVHVRVKDADPAAEFVRVFPGFVWAVRDFTLQLRDDERQLSEDEYLEEALRQRHGNGRAVQASNELRRCLRAFFPRRKLFVLKRPTDDTKLAQLEELREDELQPEFRRQADAFCQYIWEEAPVKVLPGGRQVTGTALACLAERYVEAIASGAVPCVESAVMALARSENTAAVAAAVAEYRQGMEQGLVLPTASRAVLVAVHEGCEHRAINIFLSRAFSDSDRSYQCQLMVELEAAKEEFCRRNEEASEQRCREVLQELWQDVELRLQRRDYVAPGGARLFQEDLGCVLEAYQGWPDKGVKAEAVLEEFLRERQALVHALCAAEAQMELLERQRAAAVAEEAAAKEAAAAQLEEQRRSLEEHKRQLEQRMLKEQRVLLEEQDRVLAHHLQEQRALLQDGFKREADVLRRQIEQLQE
ncbi:GBP1 protein, partial [Penelope pileata]|nr:GBP1 protein [Penelope pileata]